MIGLDHKCSHCLVVRPTVSRRGAVGLKSNMGPVSGFEYNVKKRTILMELIMDFGPIHGNTFKLAATLSASVYDTHTNTFNNLLCCTCWISISVGKMNTFNK